MVTDGDSVSIAMVGSGGDGIMVAGDMVLRAAAEGGHPSANLVLSEVEAEVGDGGAVARALCPGTR